MCTEDTLRDEAAARRRLALTRRDFNLLAMSAAAVALWPGLALAAEVKEATVEVETPDGKADAYFVHPAKGRHPAVLLWPDILGLRPAYQMMAKRLAESGYAVLVFNQYYREQKAPLIDKVDFDDKPVMDRIFGLAKALEANPDRVRADARAAVAFLDGQRSVDRKRKAGVMGYCATGRFAFWTASALSDRVGALATFHGGGLVVEAPTSPHRAIPDIRAQALIAIAQNDDQREPATKDTLREAFAKAGLAAEIEVYPAPHGWCTPDMSEYYDEAQAQRAWGRLLALFERALA